MGDVGDESGRGVEVGGVGCTQLRAFHFTLKSQAESSFVCFEVHEIFWGGGLN